MKQKLIFQLITNPPGLVDEYYNFNLCLKNLGDTISTGVIAISCVPTLTNFLFDNDGNPVSQLELNSIKSKEDFIKPLRFFSGISKPARYKIIFDVSYHTQGEHVIHTSLQKIIDLSIQLPMKASFSYYSTLFTPQPVTTVSEKFYLYMDLQALVHTLNVDSIEIETTVKNGEQVVNIANTTGETKKIVLSKEKYTIWYEVVPLVNGVSVEMGSIKVKWNRLENNSTVFNQTKLIIPPIEINNSPYSMKILVPTFGIVGTLFPYNVEVVNNTDLMQEFKLTVKESSAFLLGGKKEDCFSVLPYSTRTLRLDCFALIAGRQPLPLISVVSVKENRELSPNLNKLLFLLIKPR